MCETLRWVVVRAGEIEVPTCIAPHVVNLTQAHVGVVYADCGADDPAPADHDPRFEHVPRARILIDIDDGDAAFDAGYWPDVPTTSLAFDDVLEIVIPRTILQGAEEVPIPAYALAELASRIVRDGGTEPS